MSYMASNVLIVNVMIIPILVILWWQMGWKNWPKLLLVILSYPLMDIDHFVLTNVAGFAAKAPPNQKIFHVTHTIEFLVFAMILVMISLRVTSLQKARGFKAWIFPVSSDYSQKTRYYLAWAGRILLLGFVIHWLIDLVIYTVHHKWDYLYISIVQFLLKS